MHEASATSTLEPRLAFAVCTYNRADRLERLIGAMRAQECPVPFEILVVNNNSTDETEAVLTRLADETGPPLRWVTEHVQGIVAARNRAIEEALDRDVLVFIDDDELPLPGLLEAAWDAIVREGAHCAGGRIRVDFRGCRRPNWLTEELLGFLGGLDHGSCRFWIERRDTPVWAGNVAYDVAMFREDPTLRFDQRFDRAGNAIGGGEDAVMFRTLLERGARLRYRPDMVVMHEVEARRLRPSYFVRLHYRAGMRHGQYVLPEYGRKALGVPPFLVRQFVLHCIRTLGRVAAGRGALLRPLMNAAHALGTIRGYRRRRSSPA